MTKAMVVIIFQGPPIRHNYYRLTFEFLKKTINKTKDQIDKLYIVCNSFNPTVEDLDYLRMVMPKKTVIMLGQMSSHWEMMNMVAKQVIEDAVLFIDSDTCIYNPWKIHEGFNLLETGDYDVASIFDSSGKDTGFAVMEDQRRFAPYFCFMKMDKLRQTSLNFDPDSIYTDSMSRITEELLKMGCQAKRLPDDRGTVNIDDTIFPAIQPEPGYYHLRNSNGGLHILTSFLTDNESYERDKRLMPLNERCRLLAWVAVQNSLSWKEPFINDEIQNIALDWGVMNWADYLAKFKTFHGWLGELG